MDRSVTEQDAGQAQNCWLGVFKGEHPHADRNTLMWFNVAVRIAAGFVCFSSHLKVVLLTRLHFEADERTVDRVKCEQLEERLFSCNVLYTVYKTEWNAST